MPPDRKRGREVRPAPSRSMERETGLEPATSTLARWRSTTELFPLKKGWNRVGAIGASVKRAPCRAETGRAAVAASVPNGDGRRASAAHVGGGRGRASVRRVQHAAVQTQERVDRAPVVPDPGLGA